VRRNRSQIAVQKPVTKTLKTNKMQAGSVFQLPLPQILKIEYDI
jgi:hypothetical protein